VKKKVEITYKKTSDLIQSARNARVHSDEQVEQIARSLKEFGFINPVLLEPNDTIVAGHGRILAAKKVGIKEVPCIVLGFLDETQRKAFALADNKIPLNAAWDMNMLQMELQELQVSGFDMEVLAFSADELSDIFNETAGGGDSADDTHPPVVKGKAVSKIGDIWCLGEHRVMCGSATNPEQVKKLMDGEQASLVFTDPPYGISFESEHHDVIEGDDLRGENLCRDLLIPAFKEMVKSVRENSAFYIWHGVQTREDFVHAIKMAGLREIQYLIWQKPGMVMGGLDYRNIYEPCFYAARVGEAPRFFGGRDEPNVWSVTLKGEKELATTMGNGLLLIDENHGGKIYIKAKETKNKKVRTLRVGAGQSVVVYNEDRHGTLWEVAKDTVKTVHPTQKPVELAMRAINNSSQPGEIVLDLFLGSGMTLIGAEKLKRRCFGMDLDPAYVDVVVQRYQSFTGKEAKLQGSGSSFTKVMEERL